MSLSSIICLESDGSYSKIVTNDNYLSIYTSKSLKYYEKLLPSHSFIRLHNKFIVNIHYVKYIRRGSHWKVELINKTILNVSDEKKKYLLKILGLKYERFDDNNEL